MVVWLKAAIGIGVLYWLTEYTDTGRQIVAQLRQCPEGSFPGPWFSCVPNCPTGTFPAVAAVDFTEAGIPKGTMYCARHGGVGFVDPDTGKQIDEPTARMGTYDENSIAATGANGTTISVRVANLSQRPRGYG